MDGAHVTVTAKLAGDLLVDNLTVFTFSLAMSLKDMYEAHAYPLVVLIGGFSGVWPVDALGIHTGASVALGFGPMIPIFYTPSFIPIFYTRLFAPSSHTVPDCSVLKSSPNRSKTARSCRSPSPSPPSIERRPYLKCLLLLYSWFAPPWLLPPRRRGRMLQVLDVMGP